MKAIEKVLAATDFSADADRAVARAARVAAEQGASLTLLHVVSRRALEAAAGLHGVPADFEARLVRDATDHLARLSLALPPTKKVLTSVKVGAPRKEIFEAANAADLLVLGVRGTNPVRDLLLGTTAERMVSKANLPILIVKRPSMDTYRRVLAPVDLSEQSATVLAAAARIAPSGKINAANAFVVPFEGHLHIAGVAHDQIERYRIDAREQARAQIEQLLVGMNEDPGRWRRAVVHGDPTPVILDLEQQMKADLIVMSKQGRSLLTELLIGSVTRRTLADAQCDVLVVPSS